MRRVGALFFCLILLACGHKTSPIPYGVGDQANLPPLVKARAHFRGETLRLTAQWPKKTKPKDLMLEAFISEASCPSCEEEPKLKIIFSPRKRPKIIKSQLQTHFPPPTIQVRLSPSIELLFPPGYFGSAPLEGRLRLRLAPLSNQGDPGPATPNLTPHTQRPLPLPQVRVQVTPTCPEPNCASAPSLTLTWEGATPLVDELLFLTGGVGLRLYRLNQGQEHWLAGPLYSGSYHLLAPSGKLIARSVDSWGNESTAVTLYESKESQ